jgi:hypothetical protein
MAMAIAMVIAGGLTILFSFAARAQGGAAKPATTPAATSGAASKGGGSKKTTINFEDQLIEGQAQKPELFYLLQQRSNNFKRLIRLRENFLPEMRKTSEDVGRPPGGRGGGT